jgi:hypothetical protein
VYTYVLSFVAKGGLRTKNSFHHHTLEKLFARPGDLLILRTDERLQYGVVSFATDGRVCSRNRLERAGARLTHDRLCRWSEGTDTHKTEFRYTKCEVIFAMYDMELRTDGGSEREGDLRW